MPAIQSESPVLVGVDGGGSSATVRAVAGDHVVFTASGGAANAVSTPPHLLERHLDDALEGCPIPARIGACFAGIGAHRARETVERYFTRRFPDAEVRFAPDYVAALLAGGDRFDIYAIAGTGSVCCSLAGGAVRVSGGRGYLLGDHGSAYRYGQALVGFALELPRSAIPEIVTRALTDVFGTVDRRDIVRIVHGSAAPASVLARLAPALTTSADAGEGWAKDLVSNEAAAFARTVIVHVKRFHPTLDPVRVGLAGGVWRSESVRASFEAALASELAGTIVTCQRLGVDPVVGAVTLARMPVEEASVFGC